MTATPWGDPRDLHARTRPAADDGGTVRERVHAAMVTAVAERGYDAIREDDLAELAGVTRAAFDAEFDDRLGCFVATLEATLELAAAAATAAVRPEADWRARIELSFQALLEFVAAYPAAARLCLVDVYAAGPAAVAALDRRTRTVGRWAISTIEQSPERASMPRDIVRAAVGGVRHIVQARIMAGRTSELPGLAPALVDWLLTYRTPPVDLPPAIAGAPPPPEDVRDRRGLDRSSRVAALEESVVRMRDTAVRAYRAAPDWTRGVRDGLRALLEYLSTHPAEARLATEVVWAGPAVRARFDALAVGFAIQLAEGLRGRSPAPGLAAEAIGFSIATLIFERTTRQGPEQLEEIGPVATFVALAPAVGAIEACAVVE
ncbi:MAG: hypothetical protein GXY03_12390 [Solirubrobacterales bacterium]|nr:hypothetical protein [Solirubrobacterales bacterium]